MVSGPLATTLVSKKRSHFVTFLLFAFRCSLIYTFLLYYFSTFRVRFYFSRLGVHCLCLSTFCVRSTLLLFHFPTFLLSSAFLSLHLFLSLSLPFCA